MALRLPGPWFKPRPGQKFGSRFAHPETSPQEPKNGTCASPKPGHEERVGGGVQITPP